MHVLLPGAEIPHRAVSRGCNLGTIQGIDFFHGKKPMSHCMKGP
jgi:hypothetical protein